MSLDINPGLTDTKSDFYRIFLNCELLFWLYVLLPLLSFNHWYCYHCGFHCGFPCTFSSPYLWVISAHPPAVSYFWTNEHVWQNLYLLIYVLQFQLYPFRPFSICILSILWPIPHKIPLRLKLWSCFLHIVSSLQSPILLCASNGNKSFRVSNPLMKLAPVIHFLAQNPHIISYRCGPHLWLPHESILIYPKNVPVLALFQIAFASARSSG